VKKMGGSQVASKIQNTSSSRDNSGGGTVSGISNTEFNALKDEVKSLKGTVENQDAKIKALEDKLEELAGKVDQMQ
jgi:TolA-binding protein